MSNLFDNGSFFWWVGVVEDRMDPLFLGRCRVRIVGYHSADKSILPTEDLPWAYPMQPLVSAAMSGIGQTPLGPVEGTWVVGFFRDGTDNQEPVIMGSLGGAPQASMPMAQTSSTTAPTGTLSTPDGQAVVDRRTGEPISDNSQRTQTPQVVDGELGPLTSRDLDKLFQALRQRESNGNYGIINTIGYAGAYQFGASLLMGLGYIKSNALRLLQAIPEDARPDYALQTLQKGLITQTQYDSVPENSRTKLNFYCLANDDLWTSKAQNSSSRFLRSESLQDRAIYEAFRANYRDLVRRAIIFEDDRKEVIAGYLMVAHLLGIGGAVRYSRGIVGTDQYGTKASEYYSLGFRIVQTTAPADDFESVERQANNIPEPNTPVANAPSSVASQDTNAAMVVTPPNTGFQDPNKVYPRADHLNEPDTNRLARNQKISRTIVRRKDDTRERRVLTAMNGPEWDQPIAPYNAKYPYNHVFESESGHIMEFDDTPQNERINIFHRAGTFTEIDRNGTRVNKIVGDGYEIYERNGYLLVRGKMNVTVEGECNILVRNDCNVEVDGNLKTHVHGDYELNVAGQAKIVARDGLSVRGNVGVRGNVTASGTVVGATISGQTVTGKTVSGGSVAGQQGKLGTLTGVPEPNQVTQPAAYAAWVIAEAAAKVALEASVGSAPSGPSLSAPVDARNPQDPTFPELIIPSRTEEIAFSIDALAENESENRTEINAIVSQAIEDGLVTEEELRQQPEETDRDETPAPDKPFIIPGCGDVFGQTEFVSSFRLSRNFTLGLLSSNAAVSKFAVQPQHGLSKAEIVCNLKAVAEQVLEPIKAKYPNMLVTSGFRTPGHSRANGISQHERGMAVDIQFPGTAAEQYYEIAKWIKENVAYDQMLLEYKTYGSRMPWIHLSFNRDGNRNVCSTFLNDRTAPNGRGVLVQLA